MKGDLTYVTQMPGTHSSLIWRIRFNRPFGTDGPWNATITDAVPIGIKQPEINAWQVSDLIEILDEYVLEPLHDA